MATREVFVDLQNAQLVAGPRGGGVNSINFPKPFHNDVLGLRFHFLSLNPQSNEFSPLDPYLSVDPTGASLTVKIYLATNPFTLLASAGPGAWSLDPAVANCLVGQINLLTVPMQTAIAGLTPLDELATFIELTVGLGDGEQYTVRYSPFPIRIALNVSGAPGVLPADQYYTRAEMEAMFVRFVGNAAGASITLTSGNGVYQTILQCNNDGSNASDAAAP
jgi:hypothetical protein